MNFLKNEIYRLLALALILVSLLFSLAGNAQVPYSRSYYYGHLVTRYVVTATDWDNIIASFVSRTDDMASFTALCEQSSGYPSGVNIPVSCVLGRYGSGNITYVKQDTAVWDAKWLQNYLISPATPSNNQVLKWNSGLGEWTPATDTSGSIYSAGTGMSISGSTLNANTGTALWNSNKLQGSAVSPTSPTSGKVLKWNNGLSEWTPATDTGATAVSGNGLSISGNTITVASGTAYWNANKAQGVALSATAPSNHQVLKYNSGLSEWTPATDTGSVYTAGGGITISGTTIRADSTTAVWNANKIQGIVVSAKTPTNGQVLKWNSGLSEWTPATDTGVVSLPGSGGNISGSSLTIAYSNNIWNASKLQGYAISPKAPTSNQSLKYNTGLSEWTPATDTGVYTAGGGITISGTTIKADSTTAVWNANKMQGKAISATSPTGNYYLKWNSGLSEWTPSKDTLLYTFPAAATPTVTPGAGVATTTIAGTNTAGTITITVTGAPVTGPETIATISFGSSVSFGTNSYPVISPADATTGNAFSTAQFYATGSASSWVLGINSSLGTGTFNVNYICAGK